MIATTCPFCGVGCGMVLGIEDGRVTEVRPQRSHPVSWEVALDAAAGALATARSEGGTDAVGIISSARH